MLNKCFLMGRLVADPELRHTQSGTAVANFRLAVDRDFKDKDGNRRTAAEVVADSIYFGDSGGKRSEPEGNAPERSFPPASVGFADADEDDAQLPF